QQRRLVRFRLFPRHRRVRSRREEEPRRLSRPRHQRPRAEDQLMGGYRGEEEGISTPASSPFRRWIWAGCMVAYVVPLIFLWGVTDFPESFGVPKCNGRGCIFEDWY